jgi:hypothetical protein
LLIRSLQVGVYKCSILDFGIAHLQAYKRTHKHAGCNCKLQLLHSPVVSLLLLLLVMQLQLLLIFLDMCCWCFLQGGYVCLPGALTQKYGWRTPARKRHHQQQQQKQKQQQQQFATKHCSASAAGTQRWQ